jgi:predicted TPR repeat methyltransferase
MSANGVLSQDAISRESLDLYRTAGSDYERQLLIDCNYRTPTAIALLFDRFVAQGTERGKWLDLGAGTGLLGRALGAAHRDIELLAVDNSREMLNGIGSNLYSACYTADVLEPLPFSQASIDGAFAVGLSEHIVEWSAFLENVARCLIDGGWLFFSYCPNRVDGVSVEDSGFLVHSPRVIHEALSNNFDLIFEQEIEAYQSGPDGWVTHAIVVARRCTR